VTRVLVPRAAWPDDRFPHWAVAALRAAGVRVADRGWSRWDLALVPAVRPRDRVVRARRAVGLLDVPPRPREPVLDAPLIATSAALATRAARPARVVRPAVKGVRPLNTALMKGSDPFRVASVGPLLWSAGHEHAVAAVARLIGAGRRVELHVAADGPAREVVLYTAFDLGILHAVKVEPGLRWADAVVLPAVEDRAWIEVLEAHAAGLPVVASDLPSVRELAAAELVPPRDPAALATALEALHDPDRRAELAARGRAAVATDLERCGRELLAA
jgi:glycosyltransferase involved in cell wall biosynthesis